MTEFNQVWKLFRFHFFFSLSEKETNENKLLFDWQHHKLVGIGYSIQWKHPIQYDTIRSVRTQLTIEFNKINNDKLLNNNFNAIPKICESTREKITWSNISLELSTQNKAKKSVRHEQQIIIFYHRRRREKKWRTRKSVSAIDVNLIDTWCAQSRASLVQFIRSHALCYNKKNKKSISIIIVIMEKQLRYTECNKSNVARHFPFHIPFSDLTWFSLFVHA